MDVEWIRYALLYTSCLRTMRSCRSVHFSIVFDDADVLIGILMMPDSCI